MTIRRDGVSPSALQHTTDAGLVVRIARYQQEALEEIYARHAGAVFALANRVMNDRTRAEDVTQEVFLQLWNAPEKFEPDRGSLRTFLLTKTHSRCIDVLRSDNSRRRREETDMLSIDTVLEGVEREVVDISIAEQVKAAFNMLSRDERQAIELAYFEGHTYRETAALLKAPEGTVKSRIRSGLRRLREVLPAVLEET